MFANPSAMGSSEHRRFGNKISLIDAFHNETAVTTANDLLDCADYCGPALPVPRIRKICSPQIDYACIRLKT